MPTVFLSIPTVELVDERNLEFYGKLSSMMYRIPDLEWLPDPDDQEFVTFDEFVDSVLMAQEIVEETLDLLDTYDIKGASVYYE